MNMWLYCIAIGSLMLSAPTFSLISSPKEHHSKNEAVMVPVIEGTDHPCDPDKEGQEVDISRISKQSDINCFSCKCQRGKVVCQRTLCELPKNCFLLQEKQGEKSCCLSCKDCVLNGTTYSSMSSWLDPHDPCTHYTCQSGVVTKFRPECQTPCDNPLPPRPGECCPSCNGCSLRGIKYTDNTHFTDPTNPCLTCKCQSGKITCIRQACPVLPCPFKQQFFSNTTCCPVCKGTRVVGFGGECVIGPEAFDDGSAFPLDHCTSCSCKNGTSLCHRTVCPVLECPREHQLTFGDSCCRTCRSAHQEKKLECHFSPKEVYQNGSSWKIDRCNTCTCINGNTHCSKENNCDRKSCPPGFKMIHKNGDCCPTCVESDGVCAAFGDPHYRTFDGIFYTFQGRCRYTLVTDECQKENSTARTSGRSFSIQVFNDPRQTDVPARTRALIIKIDNKHKIRLGQMMKVKILQKRIKLPYVLLGDVIIYAEAHTIVVTLPKKGIKVVWNGDSYVEVSATPNLKGSLCGLCGNYNDKPFDEYTTKLGKLVTDVNDFGSSWKVGHKKNCIRSAMKTGCSTNKQRNRNVSICSKLKRDLFKTCHKFVNPMPYLRACLTDMCSCEPKGRCFCDQFNAYVKQCSRSGVEIENWLNATGCESHWCPINSVWTQCGGVCRKTCRNHKDNQCSKKCVPGCECQNGMVWQNNKCVAPDDCPVFPISLGGKERIV